MVERGHGDIVFVTSDVVVRPRTHMASYVAAKAGLEGLARVHADGARGHRRPRRHGPPRPVVHRAGHRRGARRPSSTSCRTWEKWGLLRHNGALLPANVANAIVVMVSVPKGTHLTLIEVEPEAPVLPDRSHRVTDVLSPTSLPEPPKVSGGDDPTGHLEELRADPIGLMERTRAECGDVGEFRLADKEVVLLTGAEANEVFFRATDDDLDQAAAYPFMTPIFGEGVVFDASPERRREQLHNMALRDKQMRGHAETIQREVDEMVARWGDAGEIDLLDWFAELTIYTSSSCLIGRKFRLDLDDRFAAPLPRARAGHRRHRLRRRLRRHPVVPRPRPGPGRAGRRWSRRSWTSARWPVRPPEKDERDLLDVLMSLRDEDGALRFSADTITGMFISMMFAGHHTTSGTAAWTLIELLRHPEEMAAVVAELDELYADGTEVSYQALREMPRLEGAIKEALRLHPPLILLLRVSNIDLEVGGHVVRKGKMVGGLAVGVEPAARGVRRPRGVPPRPLPRGPGAPTPPTRGTGSRSAPAATAASAPSSP